MVLDREPLKQNSVWLWPLPVANGPEETAVGNPLTEGVCVCVWKASSYFRSEVGFYPSYNLGNVINMRALSKIEAVLLLTFNNFLSRVSGSCPTDYVHFFAHNLTEPDLCVAGDIIGAHETCTLDCLQNTVVLFKFEECGCLLDLEVKKNLSKGRLNTRSHFFKNMTGEF